MIESSFEIGPKSEKIRQTLSSPFSLIVSPGSNQQMEKSTIPISQYPRCQFCESYYSHLCINNEDGWVCSICGKINKVEYPKNGPENDDFEFDVNENVGKEVTVIFLSLNFHNDDLKIIISDLTKFINEVEERNLMIVLGNGELPLMFLCPYDPCFECKDGFIKHIQNDDEQIDYEKLKMLNAPIIRIFEKPKDFSKLIFEKKQFCTIINTLNNVTSMRGKYDCNEIYRVCELLISQFQFSPIHFVSIIPGINQKPYKLNKFYSSMIRIDILTPNLLTYTEPTVKILPGLFQLFNEDNLLRKLRYTLREKVPYQSYMKFHLTGCKASWKPNQYTLSFEDGNVLFAPIFINSSTPFVLDIHTNGSSDNINIQIVSRIFVYNETQKNYKNILRVFNRKIKLSENTDEIFSTMNLNSLIWLWITRTLNNKPRDVIAGLYRNSAKLLDMINDEDNVKTKDLTSASCSLNYYNIMNEDSNVRFQSRILLCNTAPDEYLFIPKYEQDKGIAICCDTLYCDEKNEETEKLLNNNPMLNLSIPIPDWCKTPSPNNLSILNRLRTKK